MMAGSVLRVVICPLQTLYKWKVGVNAHKTAIVAVL